MGDRPRKRDKEVSDELHSARSTALRDAIERGVAAQEELERRLLAERATRESMIDAQSRRLLAMCLAWWRRRQRISQTELARRTKTRQSAISEIEQGQADFRVSTLQRIARALGVVLEWRLSGDSWVIHYSWRHRALEYDESVQPIQIVSPSGEGSIWVAFFRERTASDRALVPRTRSSVTPVPIREPRERRYITADDLDRISLSRMSMFEPALIPPGSQ
jgi:transcriptional regulator with XRE-family HTH domain